jgi:hypothetical protein
VKSVAVLAAAAAALIAGASPAAAATHECDGLMVCVPRAGPWVVVPTGGGALRPNVQFQLTCPRGYIVGGLDAELSQRAIDVSFTGNLGSPVNPGITTSRSAVFSATYVGSTARSPSFRPHVGCMPASGGGTRVPTSAGAVRPGHPTVRRVRVMRIRPGSATVTRSCLAHERLVGAAHAVGFYSRTPPDASLVSSVSATLAVRGERVVVQVRGDAEIGSVRAVVQVQAVCAS